MHWIYVGIMLWIGLTIAPYIVGAVLSMIPLFLGAVIGFVAFAALTQDLGWAFLGLFLGGLAPYVWMDR